jgi:hypothetical protein
MDGELQPAAVAVILVTLTEFLRRIRSTSPIMAILVLILALIQGIPIAPQAGGAVSGVLRNAEGKPAARVRVSARAQQDSTASVALASLAETNEDGRYIIENIPPGQYYIVAGSIDRPTYYPGTQDMAAAKAIQVTAGARLSGFDFAVSDSSKRQEFMLASVVLTPRLQVNLRATADPGSSVPVFSPSGAVTFHFERVSDGATSMTPITNSTITLELQAAGTATNYRVRITNLPEGFIVSKLTYGSTDLTSGILTLPAVPQNAGGPTFATMFVGTPGTSDTLTATIGRASSPLSTGGGVRVTGLNRPSDTHPVYLSGRPGIVFSDGTFEFRDVAPGRHVIASIDFPGRALGTTLIVGTQNIDNVTLDDIAALPTDIQTPAAPGPVGNATPGSRIRPVVLRGVVLDRTTRQPPPSGQAYISGRRGPSYHLDEEGRFEVEGLLPGTYNLEVQVAGYAPITRELKVGVDDIRLDLEIEK